MRLCSFEESRNSLRQGVYYWLHALLLALAPGVLCLAQSRPSDNTPLSLSSPTDLSITKEVTEVNLTLSVIDRKGHFVPNLTPDDLTIQDNGQPPQKVTYFEQQSQLPLRIAILIDESDSVKHVLEEQKRAAMTFLKHVFRPADLALIIGFTQHAQMSQSPTDDLHLLTHALKSLRGGGETAIYDAIVSAVDALKQIKDQFPCRRLVILLTDGQDNASAADLKSAIETAQRNEISVYVVIVGYPEQDSRTAMGQLADLTGGMSSSANDPTVIDVAFSKLDGNLRSQYAIGYKPLNAAADGSFHLITVQVSKKLRARYRHGYFAK